MKKKQIGFTLIELMISLALGLIVVAAAILLFLTGQKSIAMQKGVSELQDNANFGLNYITKDIRLANLNTSTAAINDQTLYGGVVLTSDASDDVVEASGVKSPTLPTTIVVADALLSQGDDRVAVGTSPQWTGSSNAEDTSGTALTSDQLVIQYLPQYTVNGTNYDGGFDCEGNAILFPKTENLRIYVQRYFLREDDNQATNETSPLALACDAGYYAIGDFHGDIPATGSSPAIPATIPATAPTVITNYGGAGEIIMKRVDHFRVLLGVQSDVAAAASTPASTTHQYLSIKDYMGMTAPRPRILSIQLGALVRSTQSVGAESAVRADQQFQILDQTVKLKTSTDPKYIRQVVSQTIALRNALGERE